MNSIGEVVYLANPNKHKDPLVIQQRYEAVLEATSRLMEMEIIVYSPIVHMHCLKFRPHIIREWNFFRKYDEAMLSRCNELWILDLDGWDISDGVMGECRIAKKLNIPIYLLSARILLERNELDRILFDIIL